jgi:hypothetical protein
MPTKHVDEFLADTCFKHKSRLSQKTIPFQPRDFPTELSFLAPPAWWTPRESSAAIGDSCSGNGVGLGISLIEYGDRTVIYIDVGIA